MVTHDLSDATFLADRIAVIEAGRVLQVGPSAELLARPAHPRVAQLVGVRNIFPGRVQVVTSDGVLVRVGQRTLLTQPAVAQVQFAEGDAVYVCLRGERVTLVLPERSASPRANLAEGEVIEEFRNGTAAVLLFRLNGPRLAPERDYDLEIELPMYVYERLRLTENRTWTISIASSVLHLLPAEREDPSSTGAATFASQADVTAVAHRSAL